MPQKKALAEYYLLTGEKRSIEIAKNIAEWGKKWGQKVCDSCRKPEPQMRFSVSIWLCKECWERESDRTCPKFRSAAKEKDG